MGLFFSLLKALLDFEIYIKYKDLIDYAFIKENYPELYRMFLCLDALHKEGNPTTHTPETLEVVFYTQYPKADQATYGRLFETLKQTSYEVSKVLDYLQALHQRAKALRLAQTALRVAESTAQWDELQELLAEQDEPDILEEEEVSDFVTDDLDELYNDTYHSTGLRWRLESLNRNLGSLRQGDFGFIFARPETGKTTLLSSEVTFMAEQIPDDKGPALWFNNEEGGKKVIVRCYQASLGLTTQELYSDVPGNKAKFYERTRRKLQIIDDAGLTKKRVEEVCKKHKPSLIVIDQLPKVRGFDADRDDLELQQCAQWARELSKEYAPTIGIFQAGATGDGKKWLTMNDVNNSKTGVQGEADWILGVGKTYDQEFMRFMHLSKNKLPPEETSDPTMRHGKWEVKIKPEIARYEDY